MNVSLVCKRIFHIVGPNIIELENYTETLKCRIKNRGWQLYLYRTEDKNKFVHLY